MKKLPGRSPVSKSLALIQSIILFAGVLMGTSAFGQTVGLAPAAPINLWGGINTTNNFNILMGVKETGGGAATNIVLNISGTNATTIFGRYTPTNIFTNSGAAILVISLTNAASSYNPLTASASGDAVFSTNFNLFVVPQWAQTNSGSRGVWSDPTMWTGGAVPTAADHVLMSHGLLGPWTNVVDGSRSIQSLLYLGDADDASAAPGVYTVITNGATLSVLGTNGFIIGRRVTAGSRPFYFFFGESLLVSNSLANVAIVDGDANATRFLTVNMTNLNTFTAAVNRFGVADVTVGVNSADGAQMVNVLLARTNTITASFTDDYSALDFNTAIQYNRQDQAGNNVQAVSFQLGQVNNIFADSVGVGRGGAVGNGSGAFSTFGYPMKFAAPFSNSVAPFATALFRNTNGGRMSLLAIGVDAGRVNLSNNRGVVDLRGGNVDMLVDQVWVGRNRTNSGASDALGGFYFDNGIVDANIVRLGNYQFTNSGAVSGYLMVGGGSNAVMKVNKYIELAHIPADVTGFEAPAATALGQIQIKANGTLLANAIICGTNSAINNQILVNTGGSLVLTNTAGDSTNKLSVLNVNHSALTFHLDGSVITTNIITKSIVFAGAPNVINIGAVKNLATVPQRFTLIAYDSAATAPAFTKGSVPVGFNGTVNNTGIPTGIVYIDITTNSPKTLIWRGYQSGNWDHSSTNWWDPVALTSTNTFNDGDFVIFDDSIVANPTISVTESVSPGQSVGTPGMAITNTTTAYVFNNGGGTIGLSSLVKSGANNLAINCHSTLSIQINQGLVLGSGDVGAVNVNSGAAFSFSGNINGALSCSGIATNSGTITGNLSVGNGGIVDNIGTANGTLSVSDNAFLYNQGNLFNIGTAASFGTNSTFINSGNLTGGGMTINGTYIDNGGGTLTFSNVTTISGNATFLVGNADGHTQVEYDPLGSSAVAPQRARVLLSNNSTNFFGVNANTGSANTLLSFSVDFGNNNTLGGGGGVIVITNVGAAPLAAGQSYQLFENVSGDTVLYEAGTNTAPVIRPSAPGPGLAWDTRTLRQDGLIKIIGVSTNPASFKFTPFITNSLVLFTGFVTNNTTLAVTTNYSTNRAVIINFNWPSTNLGWRLQQQISSVQSGIRAGDSNWTYVYPSWWTNQISVTNTFVTNAADFYRMVYP